MPATNKRYNVELCANYEMPATDTIRVTCEITQRETVYQSYSDNDRHIVHVDNTNVPDIETVGYPWH